MKTNERVIHIIFRFVQIFFGFAYMALLTSHIDIDRFVERVEDNIELVMQALPNQDLLDFEAQNIITWKEITTPPTQTDCLICYTKYLDNTKVVQLACHDNHIYCYDCFKKYLQNVRYNNESKKCPMCQ